MRKSIMIISLLLALVVVLSACQPTPQATQPPAAQQTPLTSPPAVSGEPVTLRVWTHQNDAFNTGLQEMADAYRSEYP
ncbi:MAG TPA: hypothetical protein VI755_15950, partial [Anaerolineales bacterium]|nr:hypothetical protein [Anaerolineales bacterium]